MRICRKCMKEFTNQYRICRDCGAILEETNDEHFMAADAPSSDGLMQSGTDRLAADSNAVNRSDSADVPPVVNQPSWACPQCGEVVPGTFDLCWKCLTYRDGKKADQSEIEILDDRIALNGEPEPIDPVEEKGDADEAEPLEPLCLARSEPVLVCPRCGSAQMMLSVLVGDEGQVTGSLRVMVFGDPHAVFFKDRLSGELKADICGQCGHVELRVLNPLELYRHYRQAAR